MAQEISNQEGAGDRADSPGKIQQAHRSSHVRRRQLGGTKVYRRSRQAVSVPVDRDAHGGKKPRPQAEARQSERKTKISGADHLRKSQPRQQPTGGQCAQKASEILREKKHRRLSFGQVPAMGKIRQHGTEHRHADADKHKSQMEVSPFQARIRSGGGLGGRCGSLIGHLRYEFPVSHAPLI